MKIVCNVCDRRNSDKNLHCPRTDCPFHHIKLYGSGQQIGDIRVSKVRYVMKTATIYEGIQSGKEVLVKVANPGCIQQLQQEAKALATVSALREKAMQPNPISRVTRWYKLNEHRAHLKDPLPGYLRLLPAFVSADIDEYPYGTTTIDGKKVVYSVFENMEGVLLRDWLKDSPIVWYPNAVFLTMEIATAIDYLNSEMDLFHLNLSPNNILVRRDSEGYLRPTLLDLGVVQRIHRKENDRSMGKYKISMKTIQWLIENGNLAYLAPELIRHFQSETNTSHSSYYANHRLDVYSVGLILYELMAGQPRFHREISRNEDITTIVTKDLFQPIIRQDIAETELIKLAEKATENDITARYPASVSDIFDKLAKILKVADVPEEKVERSFAEKIQAGVIVVGFALSLLVILGIATAPPPV